LRGVMLSNLGEGRMAEAGYSLISEVPIINLKPK